MASVPPHVLLPLARLLGSDVVHRLAGPALRAVPPLPLVLVARMAERRPAGGGSDPAETSPLLDPIDGATDASGPLGGEAVVVKDSLDVAEMPTGMGLRERSAPAERDATVVARVRGGGGRLFAKTKMTELGTDGLGTLMPYAMPANPRAPGYLPGGSSTGTAVAVASGLARYGIGGDGLGSVRIPAAFCGLVGLKPSQDRLPSDGYPSPAPTMDVPGPITVDVADCARLWQVMAGERVEVLAPYVPQVVGLAHELRPELACPVVLQAFRRVLRRLGVRTVRLSIAGAERAPGLGVVAAASELARSRYAGLDLTPAGRLSVAIGLALRGDEAQALLHVRREALREATHRALEAVEVLAMPTTALPPPAIEPGVLAGGTDGVLLRAVGAFTPIANLTGLPAIAVPCGVDARGRPLSIMFMGRRGSERTLLQIALAVERTGVATEPL